jgi:hypothetical protein
MPYRQVHEKGRTMILKAVIDDLEYSLNVPEAVLSQGEEFFAKMDADMDKGWQMSREWVRSPNRAERCQIVANKLLSALEKENEKLGMLMAGYILSRMPEIHTVEIDIAGEIQNTQLIADTQRSSSAETGAALEQEIGEEELDRLGATEAGGNEVTKVFKVGKVYRFSVFDRDSGSWRDSPMFASEEEAERQRREALKERLVAVRHNN